MAKDNMRSGNGYSSGNNMGNSYTSGADMGNSYSSGSSSSGSSYSSGSNMSSGSGASGGCPSTPNSSIRCTVSSCANHCQSQDYCGLDTVQIGTHESNPTKTECVDCNSFQLK